MLFGIFFVVHVDYKENKNNSLMQIIVNYKLPLFLYFKYFLIDARPGFL